LGTLTLNNTTVSNNTAAVLGGGIYNYYGTTSIQNSILADNSASGYGQDCYGTITSEGYNIIGDTIDCSISATTGDQFNIDPQLGTFLPMQGYHPLTVGSPAINAGNPVTCLPTDQRSLARVGNCDIGAYEYTTPGSAVNFLMLSGSDQSATATFAFPKPLQAVALDGQGSPVSGVDVTFTTPTSGASGTFASTGTGTLSTSTDAGGVASTTVFTANTQGGAYVVSALANNLSSVNFNLQNLFLYYVAKTGNDSNNCFVPEFPCLTINGAIGKAANGELIRVAIGTYTEPEILIDKSIVLTGGWDASFSTQSGTSTIDGEGARRGITTTSNSVVIDSFTIQNGFHATQGGGIHNSGALTLSNSIVTGNVSHWMGGGIYSTGTMTINNTSISANSTGNGGSGGAGGGGIENNGGVMTLIGLLTKFA
jgi:hypothetical protein